MSRKTWYLAAVLILLLLTPQILRAEDGLSLESLLERVETLFQGQDDLRERMAAVETQIASTPTKTPRPTKTLTPTPNVNATATPRARYRATQVAQANAKSTRQARANANATATARAKPTSTPRPKAGWAELAYSQAITPILREVATNLFGLGDAFNEPNFADMEWQNLVFAHSLMIQIAYDSAARIDPPTSMKNIHEEFMRGLTECEEGATLVIRGVSNMDPNAIEKATLHMSQCNEHMERANEMLHSTFPELRDP